MKELYEDLLGPDAPQIMRQAADQHADLLEPNEKEAVDILTQHPAELREEHKQSLCHLLMAIADDFASRRRAMMLRQQTESRRDEYDEDWVPDEDGNAPRKPVPDDVDLEAFLDDLED